MIVAVVYYMASRLNLFFCFVFFFFNLPAFEKKNRGLWPFPWKWSVWQNPDQKEQGKIKSLFSLGKNQSQLPELKITYDPNNHCQNLLWWLTLHYSWGIFRLLCYIYIYIHSDIELDMKQLTVKSHERNTNLWDYQSGRTVMEVEKPLPRIKMSGI